jgi:hypothetical protein
VKVLVRKEPATPLRVAVSGSVAAKLKRVDLRNADLEGAVLTGASLEGADLENANFDGHLWEQRLTWRRFGQRVSIPLPLA